METRRVDVESGAGEELKDLHQSERFPAAQFDDVDGNSGTYAGIQELQEVKNDESPELISKLKRAWSSKLFNAHLRGWHPEKQEYGRWDNIFLAYQSLGVVFGDLGTSPLYVYPTIQIDAPTETDLMGILSLIFWTVTLVPLVKYVFIVLQADDHGEGGTFAVYSLLCQRANVGQNVANQLSRRDTDSQLSFFSQSNLKPNRNWCKDFLESSKKAQGILLVVVIIGTCMVIGDGVLTPAISVLSAIQGVQTEFPSISQSAVVIITALILIGLFTLQRFGTKRVSFLFSPIMTMWCLTIFSTGVYNIVTQAPQVLKAISPHYIILFFSNNHKHAWLALGGIVLCITGAEAMFADLGHFNRRSIQIAFVSMIYPSTLAAYAGETAYLINHLEGNPDLHTKAFFASVPKGVFWPVFVISTLAAVVASQSLISAAFSVVKQSTALGCFPRVTLVHTSSNKEGQIYIPEINYVLMILSLVVLAGFRDAVQLGNAFGVTVLWVMFITTGLISLVMLVIWEIPSYIVLLFFGVYGLVEGVYLSSVMYKFPQGGWVPFAISVFFGVIMLSWNYGYQRKYEYELQTKLGTSELASLLTSTKIQRVPGICFFYSNLTQGIPPIIAHYVKNVRTLHQIIVFTSIRYLPVVTVLPSERFLVSSLGHTGVYRCVARYGYMDSIGVEGNQFKTLLLQSVKDYLQCPSSHQAKFLKGANLDETHALNLVAEGVNSSTEMSDLEDAEKEEVVYVLGNVKISTSEESTWWKKLVIDKIYHFLRKNCRSAFDTLNVPASNSLEIGMVYKLDM